MIFTQRIAEGDGAFGKQGSVPRNQGRGAHFGKSARAQALAQRGFEIVSAVGFRFRGEPAAILQRHALDPKDANDFFDQISFALKVSAKTWDAPCRFGFVGLRLLQTESFENLNDAVPGHADSEEFIATFVAQRNVGRRFRLRPGSGDLGRGIPAGQFLHQFRNPL